MVTQMMLSTSAERRLPDRDGESFVTRIPIVVPLFAVLIAVLAYFIIWAVL